MNAGRIPRAFSLIAALVLSIAALAVWRKQGPAPLPPDAPADVFSAGRAHRVLEAILGKSEPHPVGSAAAARVRERILRQLRADGYQPRVQQGFGCNVKGHCAHVRNVIATLPGTHPGPAVLVATHYDSVPAGPGAADDGAGVAAALEVARILRRESPPRNTLMLLFDEGEEAGLCGAESFVAEDPAAARVAVVLNLEARGTLGPSLMFETSRDAGWLVSEMARQIARPASSSLFPTIYERLPNNTDLSVFKRAGHAGLNFALIGGATRYHTPLDDLSHLSLASLQHHGDNLLGMLRGLLQVPLEDRPRGDLVFFDLLQWRLVTWPRAATLPLTLVALVLAMLAVSRSFGAGRQPWRQLLLALTACAGSLLASAAAGGIVTLVARLPASAATAWPARPWPIGVAVSTAVAAICLAIACRSLRRSSSLAWTCSVSLLLAAFSLILALLLPGAVFLTLVGSLVMSSLLLVAGLTRRDSIQTAAGGAGAVVQALILLPHALLLYDAVGVMVLPAVALLLALTLCPWAALFGAVRSPRARAVLCWSLSAVAGMALVMMSIKNEFTPDSPRAVNLVRVERLDRASAFFVAEPGPGGPVALPGSWRGLQPWAAARDAVIPWQSPVGRHVAAVGPSAMAGPDAEVGAATPAAGGIRQINLRLRHSHDAARIGLATAGADRIAGITVNGWKLDPSRCKLASGWLRAVVKSPSPDGVLVQLTVRGPGPLDLMLDEEVFGVPVGAAALAAKRGSTITPIHDGDRTVRIRRLTLF